MKGFSLPEMLVVVVLLAIISAIAWPNFQSWISKQQGKAVVRQLLSAINYARSEAVKTGQGMVLCGIGEQQHCNKDWSAGYVLMAQQNHEPRVIKRYPALKGQLTWQGMRQGLYFSSQGFLTVNNGTFHWQSRDHKQQMNVVVNRLGRVFAQ